jgi:tetratricopeptide (TPR) repeat protein
MKDESDEVLRKVSELCNDERELEAEVLVKEQLANDPDNLDLMTQLAIIQARLCNDLEAESTFKAVLVRDPNHEDAVCGLGRLLDQALRTEEAQQLYKDFLSRNPKGHCAIEDLCRILLSEGQTARALQIAHTHSEEYGGSPDAYNALRYLLNILEDDLEDELFDDRENEEIFTSLMNNLLEQIEIVNRIQSIGDLSDALQRELDDDKTRLICEIDQLLGSAPSRNITVPSELQKRFLSFK